jgi:hypothetical protein
VIARFRTLKLFRRIAAIVYRFWRPSANEKRWLAQVVNGFITKTS